MTGDKDANVECRILNENMENNDSDYDRFSVKKIHGFLYRSI